MLLSRSARSHRHRALRNSDKFSISTRNSFSVESRKTFLIFLSWDFRHCVCCNKANRSKMGRKFLSFVQVNANMETSIEIGGNFKSCIVWKIFLTKMTKNWFKLPARHVNCPLGGERWAESEGTETFSLWKLSLIWMRPLSAETHGAIWQIKRSFL